MEHNDPVFVIQEFYGKEIKNIYHKLLEDQ